MFFIVEASNFQYSWVASIGFKGDCLYRYPAFVVTSSFELLAVVGDISHFIVDCQDAGNFFKAFFTGNGQGLGTSVDWSTSRLVHLGVFLHLQETFGSALPLSLRIAATELSVVERELSETTLLFAFIRTV
jgi:hypothetical protein